MEMNVELDGVDKVVEKLNPDVYKKALNSSINKTGGSTKTKVTKAIGTRYNIPARVTKRYMEVRKSRYSDMSYNLHISSKTRNTIHFAKKSMSIKKGNIGGVQVKIRKDRGYSTIKGGFVGNRGQTIFTRIKGTQMKSNPKKEKIKAVHTLSIPQMVRPKDQKEIMNESQKHFKKTFKHQLEFYLGKA